MGCGSSRTCARHLGGETAVRTLRCVHSPAAGPQHAWLRVLALPALARRAGALSTLPAAAGHELPRVSAPGPYSGGRGLSSIRLLPSWALTSCSENRPRAVIRSTSPASGALAICDNGEEQERPEEDREVDEEQQRQLNEHQPELGQGVGREDLTQPVERMKERRADAREREERLAQGQQCQRDRDVD